MDVIRIAKDEWEQAVGLPATTFGACCAQANDHTFPVLEELGHYDDYPREVAAWYEKVAKEVVHAVEAGRVGRDVLTDGDWTGPAPKEADAASGAAPSERGYP